MNFEVVLSEENLTYYADTVYLIVSPWDDYGYRTSFFVRYIDEGGSMVDIGNVKIGNMNNSAGYIHEKIRKEFNKLEEGFFSLGQSAEYYENIKQLGDNFRIKYFESLRDIAYSNKIYNATKLEGVMKTSLFRKVNFYTFENQFIRIAKGREKLVNYSFNYYFTNDSSVNMDFEVKYESLKPTNMHAVIGRNSVGKTYFINDLIKQICRFRVSRKNSRVKGTDFSNIIKVSFSAFDSLQINEELTRSTNELGSDNFLVCVGLGGNEPIDLNKKMTDDFISNTIDCRNNLAKMLILEEAVETLCTDPVFKDSQIDVVLRRDDSVIDNIDNIDEYKGILRSLFQRLSSGHKVILLSLIQIINNLVEKTLVLIDEPENHLHPPLLSAYMVAISNALIKKNGVAIVATHSPVVLQGMPKSCVWIMSRVGYSIKTERPQGETFGGSVGIITKEVFDLSVESLGYTKIIEKLAEDCSTYEEAMAKLGGELGEEGQVVLIKCLRDNNEKS